jgi:hypothetical protein
VRLNWEALLLSVIFYTQNNTLVRTCGVNKKNIKLSNRKAWVSRGTRSCAAQSIFPGR